MTGDASENTVPIDNTLRQFISNNDMLEIMSSLIDGPEFSNIMIPRERDFRGVENMIMMPPPILRKKVANVIPNKIPVSSIYGIWNRLSVISTIGGLKNRSPMP